MIDYDDRIFTTVTNSATGDVGAGTRFHYHHLADIVWATYQGGAVAFGTLIAQVQKDGSLDMRYQHVTADGAIKTGRCLSRPEILVDGRIRLHEQWQWLEGGTQTGESIIEEIIPPA
ncbi:MAG: n-acetylglutamate synthase [Vicinamibacterales bacterium]